MRTKSGVTFALAGVLCIGFVLPVSSADHDVCGGVVTMVPFGSEVLYVDERADSGLWVYHENGLADGLQLGGDIAGVIVDPCGDSDVADDLIAHVPTSP